MRDRAGARVHHAVEVGQQKIDALERGRRGPGAASAERTHPDLVFLHDLDDVHPERS